VNAIIDAAIGRSRMVVSALALILLAGLSAYLTIPKESDPDINIPILYVKLTHEGISPEDAERLLVRPVERELRAIGGLKEMRAVAHEGGGSVILEFTAGFDVEKAKNDVREKVDLVKPDLPADADEPTVHEVNVGLFPVIVVTLAGDVPERTLRKLGRDLRDDLQSLRGVLEAEIVGDREELLEVVVDPSRLDSYGITQADLFNMVNANNRLVAAGALDTGQGRFAVKVPGLFKSARDVLELPIKVNGDAVVRVGDVATVQRTFKDAISYARVNGRPAVAIEVKKRLGENIIETIEAVRATVAERQKAWPAGVEVTFQQDRSGDIRTMLGDLQNNVLSAVVLVMIVVVAALGLRTGLLVGIAIPASFLFAMLALQVLALTINIVVLFSLILAVGMLVDGAIVVTEFADRKMAEGLHRRQAYALAAKRMAWPVIASTLTTLAAFLPLLFWPGVVGEFMKYLPLTLIVTLTGSLVSALIFTPTLGALVGRPGDADPKTMRALAAAETGDVRELPGLTGSYARMLARVIRRPTLVALACAATLVGVQYYYWGHGNGVEFFPDVEPEQALVYVHARGNLSTEEKDALVREVEALVMQVAGIETVYARTGKVEGGGMGQDVSEDVVGTIYLELAEWRRRAPVREIMAEIRARTATLAGIHVETRKPDAGPPQGKDVQIELRSREPEALPAAADIVRRKMQSMADLRDIEDGKPLPGIEWQLAVDRAQAGRYGADVAQVGNMVQLVTNGVLLGAYRPDDADDEVDIRVRYPLAYRSLDQLDRLKVQTPQGLVPLSQFVTRTAEPKTGTLNRTDGQRALKVQANVAEGVLKDDKVNELKAWLATQPLDVAVQAKFKGADQEQQEAQAFLGNAFGVAIFLIAIILVTQFNSFYHALLVLSAIVMSTVGVFLGLLITGQTFGIVMTGIGVIALAGIVVNNNIVLIDTYQTLLKGGMAPAEAVVRTGAQRLRPVVLTTITTILGLVPMMLMVNVDFFTPEVTIGAPSTQWWVQLSTAVAYGLAFSTVLTLIVTPSLLMLGANTSAALARRRARRAAKLEATAAPAEPPALARKHAAE